ncbi:uncharacterized protein LOC143228532 [Tachypleus tridentatus]|uniref:uncharacterized protein LOC143228532 n=1 Tax=Tachypleus tridentatus TaxID=6853 RepID=UPI003FD4F019
MKFKHIAFLVWIIFRFEVSAVVPSQITIGIIFRATNTWNLLAGELAVDDVNNDPTILPDTRLALLTNITENSKFNILQNTCYLLEQNVVTIIGPSSSTHIKVAHSPIGNLRVPHLAPTATDPTLSFTQAGQSPYPSLIKMTPPDSFQMAALTTFMLKFKWKAIAVIAESTDYGKANFIHFR